MRFTGGLPVFHRVSNFGRIFYVCFHYFQCYELNETFYEISLVYIFRRKRYQHFNEFYIRVGMFDGNTNYEN